MKLWDVKADVILCCGEVVAVKIDHRGRPAWQATRSWPEAIEGCKARLFARDALAQMGPEGLEAMLRSAPAAQDPEELRLRHACWVGLGA